MKVLILFAFALATACSASVLKEPLGKPLEQPLEQPLEEPLEQPLEKTYEKAVFPEDLRVDSVVEQEGRITNGHNAHNGQFPYQAGLSIQNNNGMFWCGATLIHHEYVLTAAHCTDGAHTVTVYLGNVWRGAGYALTVHTPQVRNHAGYNRHTLANDIALVRIPYVNYNGEINAAHLPWDNWSYAGWQAVTSGWGGIYDGSGIQNELKYTRQPIIENWECANVYGSETVNSGTICIATPHGSSTCGGDSGGPLVIDGTWNLVGVTSFVSGAGCQSGQPAGFSRVSHFRGWIRDNTGGVV